MNKIEIKRKMLNLLKIPLLRNFVHSWGDEFTILYFHRVIDDNRIHLEDGPNRSLCVSTSFFNKLIKYLSNEYKIISLDNLKNIKNSKESKKFLCITFDDGYLDNYENAVPILKLYNVPATFYITNDFIDGNGNVWWYEIWDLINNSSNLDFLFKGKSYNLKTHNKKYRTVAFKKIRSLIMSLNLKDIHYLLEVITNKAKRKNYSNKFMSWNEILEIDKYPEFTIGCHTLSHPILKNETFKNAKNQIYKSKTLIEKKLNHKIKHLAYPFGGKNEVSEREFKIAQECGFDTAVTTSIFKKNNNIFFNLPRVAITDFYDLNEIDVRINGLSNFLGIQFG